MITALRFCVSLHGFTHTHPGPFSTERVPVQLVINTCSFSSRHWKQTIVCCCV